MACVSRGPELPHRKQADRNTGANGNRPGIAQEITGGRRNRLLVYDAYLAILSEGTEPLRFPG